MKTSAHITATAPSPYRQREARHTHALHTPGDPDARNGAAGRLAKPSARIISRSVPRLRWLPQPVWARQRLLQERLAHGPNRRDERLCPGG